MASFVDGRGFMMSSAVIASTIFVAGGCTYDFHDSGGAGGQSSSTTDGAGGVTDSTSSTNVAAGTGAGGALACEGEGADPACDDTNICTSDSCSNGKCVHVAVGDGLVPGYVDTPTDCIDNVCMNGALIQGAPEDTDVPDDMNVCTIDSCFGGMANHSPDPTMNGVSCGTNQICNDGQCVGCVTASDCAGTDTFCEARTCSAAHVCGVMTMNEGVALPTGQTAGDCKSIVCVNGAATSIDADDPMNDGNLCTSDTCVDGVVTHQNLGPTMLCGIGALCTNTTHFKPANHCLGGTCQVSTIIACAPQYSCTHDQCNTNCGNNNMCAPGFTCDLPTQTCK